MDPEKEHSSQQKLHVACLGAVGLSFVLDQKHVICFLTYALTHSSHTHVYTQTHTGTYTDTHRHIYKATHTHVYTLTDTHIETHTDTHSHTYTFTHTHAYTPLHTHTQRTRKCTMN